MEGERNYLFLALSYVSFQRHLSPPTEFYVSQLQQKACRSPFVNPYQI